MIWTWLLALAIAGTPHAGIKPGDVPMLGGPTWLESGWMAPVLDPEGGQVRVYVGESEEAAAAWLQRTLGPEPLPALPLGTTEGLGNGWSLAAFRVGNVSAVVKRPAGASADLAQRMIDAIESDVPEPSPPTVEVEGHIVKVSGEWSHVLVRPAGRLDPFTLLPEPIRVIPMGSGERYLTAEPDRLEVVVWDPFGRTVTAAWTR